MPWSPSFDPFALENRVALGPEGEAEADALQAAWEAAVPTLPVWSSLAPSSAFSAGGASLKIEEGGIVRLIGAPEDKDVFTVIAPSGDRPVTGLRVEVLPDKLRPKNGPGASESGNFVLNELEVTAISISDPTMSRKVVLRNAAGSFAQNAWAFGGAIDGKPDSGWAVMPRYGERHALVAETTEDAAYKGGTLFVVTLAQNYGSQHIIGALRISTTGSPRPIRYSVLPEAAMAALAVPKSDRTAEQAAALHSEFVRAHPDMAERIRLGAAQDLAWALVNSPSFLFNR